MKMRKAQKGQRKLSCCKTGFLFLFCRDCRAVRKAPEGTETNGREAALVQGVWGIPQQAVSFAIFGDMRPCLHGIY
jgi:hypothetical protein